MGDPGHLYNTRSRSVQDIKKEPRLFFISIFYLSFETVIISSPTSLHATAVEVPLWSYTGESSFISSPTISSWLSFITAPRSSLNVTPPASGVPVPGNIEGSRTSRSSVK